MKTTLVQWDADAYKEYKELEQAVQQNKKNNKKPTYEQLITSIDKTIENLKKNPFYGDLVPRKYLTKKIIEEYGTDKIFRTELVGYWNNFLV